MAWKAPLAAIIMLGGCSKASEERSAPSGEMVGQGDAGFSSVQSKITTSDVAEDSVSSPAPPDGAPPPPPIAPAAPSAPREVTSTETRETSVGGIVTTKTTRTTSERVAMPMPTLPPIVERPTPSMPRRYEPPVQSGLLTAGDYDDLLNPRAYATYASAVLQEAGRQLPFVDTRSRISVKALDRDGRPVPFARVTVQRAGPPLILASTADGTVSFYPAFDKVSGKTRVSVSSTAGRAETLVDVARGPQNVTVPLSGRARAVQALDIALVIDTTGSMGDEISYLQAELDAIVSRVRSNAGNVDIRIGIIAYRDEGDEYVVRSFGMGRPGAAKMSLASLDAGGGGDMPEAMDQAIAAAAKLPWRPDAVKTMLLVADAPPHDERLAASLATTQSLRARGVQVVPIAASGVEDTAQYVMRTMSAMTQGRYIFLTDDSGVGNAHAEPQVSCYLVTRLDGLVARVVSGFVTGRRIEPRQEDVIREVGQYNRGRCAGEGGVSGQE